MNTMNPVVIYHGGCNDGFAAACAAHFLYGNTATYIGAAHGAPLPEIPEGAPLFLLDFSFKREILLDLARKHPSIVILDHHVTAEKALAGISEEAPNIHVVFDMEKSGAVLAWEFFHPGSPIPTLFRYVQDRDLWKHELPRSQEINEALSSYPLTFEVWGELTFGSINPLAKEGEALLRVKRKNVEAVCRDVRAALIEGHLVPAVNAPYFLASDCGHFLLQKYPEAPFAAVFRIAGDGDVHWSLRSEDARVDVGEVAASLGGGGHRNASGFSRPNSAVWPSFFPRSYDDHMQGRRE